MIFVSCLFVCLIIIVLGLEPMASGMLGKHCTAKLYPHVCQDTWAYTHRQERERRRDREEGVEGRGEKEGEREKNV